MLRAVVSRISEETVFLTNEPHAELSRSRTPPVPPV